MLAGRSGVSPLTQEWAEQLPVRIAAQLAVDPAEVLDRVKLRRLDRSEAIALIAAHQAWADAGLADSGLDPERLAVSVGSGIGGAHDPARPGRHPGGVRARGGSRPHTVPMLMPNGPAAWVGLELGAQAGVHSCGQRLRHRRRGDRARPGHHPRPAGPTWSWPAAPRRSSTRCRSPASPRCGPCRPATTSPERASRPWDKGRDGFVLGEGAAVVVLERADHAAARGARVYARLAGAGITSDGYDIVQPHPEGAGVDPGHHARRCADAGLAGDRHRARQRARHLDPGRRHGRDRRRCARRSATTRCSPRPSR